MSALLPMSSDHNKQTWRTGFRKPSKASDWHGSCASFRGNSSELLHISSSWNDSNASCMYLELYKHDGALKNTSETTAFGNKQGNGTLESEMCKLKSEEKYGVKATSRQQRFEGKYSNSVAAALIESRFNRSLLIPDCSAQLPRKLNCDEGIVNVDDDDDDDGTDAEFTDTATTNPYEYICTVLEVTMSVMERLFEESSPRLNNIFVEVTVCQSIPDNLQWKPTLLESPDRITISSNDRNSSVFQNTKDHNVHKEDKAPKRPSRLMSQYDFVFVLQ